MGFGDEAKGRRGGRGHVLASVGKGFPPFPFSCFHGILGYGMITACFKYSIVLVDQTPTLLALVGQLGGQGTHVVCLLF